MSQRRSILDFPRNETGLVDEFLGTAFDAVYQIYLNLQEVLNAKDYASQAKASQISATASALAAQLAEQGAKQSAISAAQSAVNLAEAVTTALSAQDSAKLSELAAQAYAGAARLSAAGLLAPSNVAPQVRVDGSPVQVGDRYFNTVSQTEYIYHSDGWQPNDSMEAIQELVDPVVGATKIGYTLAATDASSRHVADKLNEMPSAADFGAVLDNFTDNTQTVQKAIDSLVPVLYIPLYCKYNRAGISNYSKCLIIDDSTGIRVTSGDALWQPSPGQFTRIAHRGYANYAPENTLAAFTNAIHCGADILESDIQITADGVPVIIHDDTVERTSTGTGTVKSMTLAQLQALDNGSKFGARFSGAQIPLFEDLLKFSMQHCYLYSEIKSYRQQSDIDLTLAVIEKYKASSRIQLSSFNLSDLQYVRAKNKEVALGFLSFNSIEYLDTFASLGGDLTLIFDYNYLLANPNSVKLIRSKGIDLAAYTVDSIAVAKQLVAIGVMKVISNVYIGDIS